MAREKIINPGWMYDIVLNDARAVLAKQEGQLKRREQISHNRHVRAAQDIKRAEKVGGESLQEKLDAINQGLRDEETALEKFRFMADQTVEDARKEVDAIQKSVPVAIGPATLDSLIYREPESRREVGLGHLPFDSTFFEFINPVEFRLPFVKQPVQLRGIRFRESTVSQRGGLATLAERARKAFQNYEATLYYQSGAEVNTFKLTINPSKPTSFTGNSAGDSEGSENIFFNGDFVTGNIGYSSFDELKGDMGPKWLSLMNFFVKRFFTRGMHHKVPIEQITHYEGFKHISNLCNNIINYINAHNTTLVKGKRKVKVRPTEGKKKKVTDRDIPFYVVSVQSHLAYEQSEPSGQSQQLQWRLYVRGHYRNYRNPDESIRMTRWIAPYVKGPEDAPWKRNRYALLASKLEEERAFLARIVGTTD